METNANKSWLTWKFFGVSVLFWTAMVLIGAGLSPALDSPGALAHAACGRQCALLWHRNGGALRGLPRLGGHQVSWPLYVAKLVLIGAITSTAHQALYSAVIVAFVPGLSWLDSLWLMSFATFFQHSALIGTGAAANIYLAREAAKRELLKAQLRALRNQLQPHFLFNSLQGISASIRSEPDTAVRMITLLGDLLRQTLRERTDDLVTLADEQQLLEPYLELQRLRFADRLRVAVDLPNDVLGATVPDLILQPLVENALQHGIERIPGEGSVHISARRDGDRLELRVVDDGAGPGLAPVADGIGLGTTRSRLQALYGERAQLTLEAGDQRGTVVTVRLPWREAQDAA